VYGCDAKRLRASGYRPGTLRKMSASSASTWMICTIRCFIWFDRGSTWTSSAGT
jgi:hypothetical protein